MVRKTENGYVIEVNTTLHPANEYTETINGLINLLLSQDEQMVQNNRSVLDLLSEMMPTFEQARLMFGEDNECTLQENIKTTKGKLHINSCVV